MEQPYDQGDHRGVNRSASAFRRAVSVSVGKFVQKIRRSRQDDQMLFSSNVEHSQKKNRMFEILPIAQEQDLKHDERMLTYTNGMHMVMEGMLWHGTRITAKRLHRSLSTAINNNNNNKRSSLNNKLLRQLERECEHSAHLRHPNILLLMSLCTTKGPEQFVLLYEQVEQGSLYHFMHVHNFKLTWRQLSAIVLQMCSALHYIHSHGYIHCAITSHAVQICTSRTCKLGNFEFMEIADKEAGKTCHTDLFEQEFLYNWMAPEMILEKRATSKCDIYSLSCIIWEAVHGEVPWEKLVAKDISALCKESKLHLSLDDWIASPYDYVLSAGLCINPSDRISSVSRIREIMAFHLLSGPPETSVTSLPPSTSEVAKSFPKVLNQSSTTLKKHFNALSLKDTDIRRRQLPREQELETQCAEESHEKFIEIHETKEKGVNQATMPGDNSHAMSQQEMYTNSEVVINRSERTDDKFTITPRSDILDNEYDANSAEHEISSVNSVHSSVDGGETEVDVVKKSSECNRNNENEISSSNIIILKENTLQASSCLEIPTTQMSSESTIMYNGCNAEPMTIDNGQNDAKLKENLDSNFKILNEDYEELSTDFNRVETNAQVIDVAATSVAYENITCEALNVQHNDNQCHPTISNIIEEIIHSSVDKKSFVANEKMSNVDEIKKFDVEIQVGIHIGYLDVCTQTSQDETLEEYPNEEIKITLEEQPTNSTIMNKGHITPLNSETATIEEDQEYASFDSDSYSEHDLKAIKSRLEIIKQARPSAHFDQIIKSSLSCYSNLFSKFRNVNEKPLSQEDIKFLRRVSEPGITYNTTCMEAKMNNSLLSQTSFPNVVELTSLHEHIISEGSKTVKFQRPNSLSLKQLHEILSNIPDKEKLDVLLAKRCKVCAHKELVSCPTRLESESFEKCSNSLSCRPIASHEIIEGFDQDNGPFPVKPSPAEANLVKSETITCKTCDILEDNSVCSSLIEDYATKKSDSTTLVIDSELNEKKSKNRQLEFTYENAQTEFADLWLGTKLSASLSSQSEPISAIASSYMEDSMDYSY